MGDIEQDEREYEYREEKNAADGKPRKLAVEITELPKVRRNQGGEVTSATFTGKARFKGEVTLRLRGDVAAAYWSLTPGMKVSVQAFEKDDNDYVVDTLDVLPNA